MPSPAADAIRPVELSVGKGQVTSSALAVSGLTKRFGALAAVSDVSFEVSVGEVLAVIGPNGAGKSTLFNLITGVIRPDAGKVSFFGQPVDHLRPYARARLGLARTFQAPVPFTNMTVLENVMVGMRPRQRATWLDHALRTSRAMKEEEHLAKEARVQLARAGLDLPEHATASALTAGQQRLLAIARALSTKPKLLMLDEPAAGLNDAERSVLAGTVADLRRSGMTILLIEHAMDFVMELADRIVVLDYGRKLAEGLPSVIRNDPEVIAAYLGVD